MSPIKPLQIFSHLISPGKDPLSFDDTCMNVCQDIFRSSCFQAVYQSSHIRTWSSRKVLLAVTTSYFMSVFIAAHAGYFKREDF